MQFDVLGYLCWLGQCIFGQYCLVLVVLAAAVLCDSVGCFGAAIFGLWQCSLLWYLKLCWLQQCTLFCYFAGGVCAGCSSVVLPLGVSCLVLAAALQSVVLVFGFCAGCGSALCFSTLGLVYIVLAIALGWQFFGDGCGSAVCCAILKLVFVVLAAAVH